MRKKDPSSQRGKRRNIQYTERKRQPTGKGRTPSIYRERKEKEEKFSSKEKKEKNGRNMVKRGGRKYSPLPKKREKRMG